MHKEENLQGKEVEENDDNDEKDEEGRVRRRGRDPFRHFSLLLKKNPLWKKIPEKR